MMRLTVVMGTAFAFSSPLDNNDSRRLTGYVMDDSSIRTAVDAWLSNPTAAEATYGHISTWETGGVGDMAYLFQWEYSFNDDISAWDTSGVWTMECMFNGAAAFNQDIGAWDTSDVTTMRYMFRRAYAFNQDIGGWAVDRVTSMWQMFEDASAFDQDLGWCVEYGVDLHAAFDGTRCESTSCGIHHLMQA
jgi:surface protein